MTMRSNPGLLALLRARGEYRLAAQLEREMPDDGDGNAPIVRDNPDTIFAGEGADRVEIDPTGKSRMTTELDRLIEEIEMLHGRHAPGDDAKLDSLILKACYSGSRAIQVEHHLLRLRSIRQCIRDRQSA